MIFQEPGSGISARHQSQLSLKQKIKKYFICFRVRLNRHLGIQERSVGRNYNRRPPAGGDFPNFDELNAGKVNYSAEDCFNDMPEPLYGFVTKVTLVDNEPCELGVTCDQDANKIQRRKAWQFDRQTGEEFVSGAPPDCRTNNICRL